MSLLASLVTLLQMVLALLGNATIAHTNQVAVVTSQAIQLVEAAEGSAPQAASAAPAVSPETSPSPSPQAAVPPPLEKGGVSVSYADTTPAPTDTTPYLIWNNFSVPLVTVAEEEATSTFPITFPLNVTTNVTGTFFLSSGNPALFSIDPGGDFGSILQNLNPYLSQSYPLTIGIEQSDQIIATATAVLTPTYPNDCSPNPCENGGSCSEGFDGDAYDGFTCTCPSGYSGDECETPPITPTITFTPLTAEEGDNPITLSPSSTSAGTFTFSNDSSSIATISGSTVTIVGAGTTIITATQAASGTYLSCVATTTLTVSPGACETGAGVCDNGGTCIDGPSNTYSCSCSPCYSGPTCDQFNFVECA